jgi:hypothetical protein
MSKTYNIDSGFDFSKELWERDKLSVDDSQYIGSSITPKAYNKLLKLPQTLRHLLPVITQPFCQTPIFSLSCHGGEFSFPELKVKEKRRELENHFQKIRKLIDLNNQIQQLHIRGEAESTYTDLMNICLVIPKRSGDSESDKRPDGYYVYFKVGIEGTGPLGATCMVVYYHQILKKCVVIVSPSQEPAWALTVEHIISTSVKLPFHKDCSFCGKCSENLTKCTNCKVTRYCNKSCQVNHWKDHKTVCKQRTLKLSVHARAQSKLGMLSNHPFIVWKLNVESARAQKPLASEMEIHEKQLSEHYSHDLQVAEDESQTADIQAGLRCAMSMVSLENEKDS